MLFFQIARSATLALFFSALAACAVPSAPSGSTTAGGIACDGAPELITDPTFTTINDAGSKWRYRQHTGDQSFTIVAQEQTISFKRIGSEPWAIFRQTISDERLAGATIRYTADLQGDVSPDVTHGFGAKAGLFLQIGNHPDAFMGDQDPSNGQWDWQTYSVTKTLPVGENSVSVGFIHQAGEGAIQARNPSLVLVDCLK
ncbi:MAG: hypothetical protein P8M13_04235 [Luminiphilus sp.]|nr:hypothetical protein [Luminiphilus sp.]